MWLRAAFTLLSVVFSLPECIWAKLWGLYSRLVVLFQEHEWGNRHREPSFPPITQPYSPVLLYRGQAQSYFLCSGSVRSAAGTFKGFSRGYISRGLCLRYSASRSSCSRVMHLCIACYRQLWYKGTQSLHRQNSHTSQPLWKSDHLRLMGILPE